MKTFYWYDYETFGLSPKTSRIAQFAGIRTDMELNIISKQMFYCKPTLDALPSAEACLVTGITPLLCEQKGVIEHEFSKRIHQQFLIPDTCVVGYNSIRFDDEFTRYILYRNFMDPYTWHWKDGNTRWDILDVVRLCYALKKDNSLKWVFDQDGKPVFKLDQLAPANGIEHSDAHDALADVQATIEIAKIIKTTQPQLFEYAFGLRKKKTVGGKIQLFTPMLHTSGMYPAELSCTRLTAALAYHPHFSDRAIVFNLDQDPSILLDLEIDELKKLLFTKQTDLPKGAERLQLKELIFNKSPMFVPHIHKLEAKIIQQLRIDMPQCLRYLAFIEQNQAKITTVVQALYQNKQNLPPADDVDQALYEGFMDDADKKIALQIQTLNVSKLKDFHPNFKDQKLNKLLLHFKARNYPESLSKDEQEDWFEILHGRIQDGKNGYLSIDEYYQEITKMRQQHPKKSALWTALEQYAESLI